MTLASVIVSVVNYDAQTKKWKTTSQAAYEKYAAYLKACEAEISAAEAAYTTALSGRLRLWDAKHAA